MSNHNVKCNLNGETPEKENPVLNGVVYEIVCKSNGKRYIGSTTSVKNRFYRHLNDLRKNKHTNNILQNSFNKYGEDDFDFNILEETDYPRELEQFYLNRIDDWSKSFNICEDSRGGKIMDEEVEKKRRKSLSKTFGDGRLVGDKNPFFGKTHSQKTKDTIGFKNSQYTRSEEFKQNQRKKHLGKKHSQETKDSMSLRNMSGGNPNAKPIVIKGIEFSCKKDAIKYFNLPNYYHLDKLLNAERLEQCSYTSSGVETVTPVTLDG